MLNTVTLFCMCLCFCKNHIYFTIFVDKKNYFILIVFFYLNRTIIQFISPPVLIMSKSSVQRQRIMSLVTTSKFFDIQLILILIHMTHFIWRKETWRFYYILGRHLRFSPVASRPQLPVLVDALKLEYNTFWKAD